MIKNNKNKNKKNKRRNRKKIFTTKNMILAGGVVLLTGQVLTSEKLTSKDISYNEFVNMVAEKQVKEIKFSKNDSILIIIDKKDNKFKTINPGYETFRKEHLEKGIKFSETKSIDTMKLISLSISVAMLYMISGKVGGGKSSLLKKEDVPKETFDNVLVSQEVKDDFKLAIKYLNNPDAFEDVGAEVPTGILLYGPPGTGKTYLAKAVANEANVPFFYKSGSDFVELFAGKGAKTVRDLFKEARKKAPCVLFIDEIDAVGKARGNGSASNDEREQTLNEFLNQLDGFEDNKGVLVIAATNRLETLDEALLRPGRFGKHIRIPLPKNKEERLAILKVHASNKKVDDSTLEYMAKISTSFSGADLKNFLNESALIQKLEEKDMIDIDIADKAFFKIATKGSKISTKERFEEENKILAWHEAGHVLSSKLYGQEFIQATIIGSSSGIGGFSVSNNNDKKLLKISDLKKEVKILYSGRIAESFILDEDITIGASNDIERASNIISSMVTKYGMNNSNLMLNLDVIEDKKYLMNEATAMANELYEEAMKDLYNNKDILKDIANALLEKETIYNEDVEEILTKYEDVEEASINC